MAAASPEPRASAPVPAPSPPVAHAVKIPARNGSNAFSDDVERTSLVLLGLFAVALAVIVLAHPWLVSIDELLLLAMTVVALNSSRILIAGGRLLKARDGTWRFTRWGRTAYREIGAVGVVFVALGIAVGVVLYSGAAFTLAILLLATVLVMQGVARIIAGTGRNVPKLFQGSNIATGVVIVALALAAIAFVGFALLGLAIVLGVVLLISGTETVVAGLRPTDPRQFVLLKLIFFSAFYGLVMINWIDLFGKSVPGYGIWLILSYMAPFGVLIVFLGWEAWPLATSLGLLVSLMNDVGYYFVGNLLFGFHQELGPWIIGQLGFDGPRIVTVFEGGAFALPITSWMMGVSIYARAVVVAGILSYWWRHPTGLENTLAAGAATSPKSVV
jgi:hypothetical protein